ncbi:ABC transporter permease [Alkalicoccus chagannorensis]|uniref:ABC transporter permease n=1 Tax=Alkalicoccus chagannorensis TaxID=427072 RepID=UPI00042111C5|nr:ABC-2 transporter permease [Alkalicoccus chagannorensis]
MKEQASRHTLELLRFYLRLDRIRLGIWLVALTFFTVIVPPAFLGLYESDQERQLMAETMENPAMTAMVGTGALDDYTIGAMTAHQMLLMTAVVAGVMIILLVTRHTRTDEEDGRTELIRALPVGRRAGVQAALLYTIITAVLLALFTGFGLYALQIDTLDFEGSLLYGAALGGTVLVFGGVTAAAAQLADTGRGTIGLSITVLLGAYVFRGVTDVTNETLSWLSPLGWVSKTDAYSSNAWLPILVMIAAALALAVAAGILQERRDLGGGLLPHRAGKANAASYLAHPAALVFRLQRTALITWGVGMFVLGVSYGSVLGDMEAFIEGNEMMAAVLDPTSDLSMTEQYLPMLIVVMSMMAAIPPIIAINRMRGEEQKGRLDPILARPVSRETVFGSYAGYAVLNMLLMLTVVGSGLFAAAAASMDDAFPFTMIWQAVLAYGAATALLLGLSLFLQGFFPRLLPLVWGYLLYSFVVVYLGSLFQFPEWVMNLSPFAHVPDYPVEEMAFLPILLLSGLALLLGGAGWAGFRKRDLEG